MLCEEKPVQNHNLTRLTEDMGGGVQIKEPTLEQSQTLLHAINLLNNARHK